MSTTVRPPAVAGLFYPADPTELAHVVDGDLAEAGRRRADHEGPGTGVPPTAAPKALVVPHAGYVYSGPIAAAGYVRLADRAAPIERVMLLGPAHRVALDGMAVPTVDGFATPLGIVPVDHEARRIALDGGEVHLDDRAHADEHSLEVHLPFLQRVLGVEGWAVLPVVVGRASTDDVARLLERLWGGPETLIVVSTDLSHYHDRRTANRLDARTASAIVERADDAAGSVRRLRGLPPARTAGRRSPPRTGRPPPRPAHVRRHRR